MNKRTVTGGVSRRTALLSAGAASVGAAVGANALPAAASQRRVSEFAQLMEDRVSDFSLANGLRCFNTHTHWNTV